MATYNPLQASFAFGEMSPRLRGRSNTERYRQSVHVCEHALTFSHGNVIKRPAFMYLETSPSTGNLRLMEVQISINVVYVIEVGYKSGASYVRLLDRDGYIETAPGTPWEQAAPWADSDIPDIAFVVSTIEDEIYFAHSDQAPQALGLDLTTPSSSTFGAITFTSSPAAWGSNDYPSCVTIHDQRLWFAGSVSKPDTLWASKPNDFLDFALGTAGPGDGIEHEMSGRSKIQWIQSGQDLLIGTEFNEYIMASDGGVIIPSDKRTEKQSPYGSGKHEPVEVGNGVLYLGNDRRRIRFMNYQFLEEGWISVDITWPSEHVTEPLTQEIHFKHAPDPFLWCVMQDGTLVTAIYEREQDNLVGWHRHPIPNGFVMSGCLTKTAAASEMWIAVERTINESTVRYIERQDLSVSPDKATLFLDSGIETTVTDNGDGTFSILGLDHLEGEDVGITVEGADHVNKTVSGGEVVLNYGFEGSGAGASCQVGLEYTGKVTLLSLEGVNPGGTAQAIQKRYSRIFARLEDSALPTINGNVPASRSPSDSMGEVVPYYSGDVVVYTQGWDRFARVELEFPKPLRYNVLAVFGDVGTGKL